MIEKNTILKLEFNKEDASVKQIIALVQKLFSKKYVIETSKNIIAVRQ